ncbi:MULTISPECIES: NADH-quinone oxidoreductase subunit N [unclassified Acidiphilium]|jgi:NADH-quinone oxidoreductase subunit N|uniref:NADH-quinone oxidoreductase subunit N n=1 Tax=unclassified Acidiphilium TaxID=2617493 RepID=UPI000BC78319|nr:MULTISPECIES: NADH-quinone oxidoreductase subunit N [unclassified Acidiphilium]OYV54772.1 MAG: NADH-quinone oxidoreductase subunit N [Acidiphilium sp. 20-67-58]HQT60815.1 NADH-quinone oxidoreductase subunit N [Acidiphilium sp.]
MTAPAMTAPAFAAFAPFTLLGAVTILVMLLIAIRRDHHLVALSTIAGLLLCCIALPLAAPASPVAVTKLFIIDGAALFYAGLVLVSALVVAVLSWIYLDRVGEGPREEYYLLLLTATLGAAILPASVHFASFFLGIETLGISLLGLIAYAGPRGAGAEAGTKYLILSGAASAFLLFGMALIYAAFGSMSFDRIGALAHQAGPADLYRLVGIALILAGVAFKLSLVPFHMWTPDVYEGAPAPVTAFIAVVSKIAVFAVILRFFALAGGHADASLRAGIAAVAILSMLAGNLLALLQTNVKRLLAYSSIAHLGYLLVAFLAAPALGVDAAAYYLAAYAVTSLGAFGIIALLSAPGAERDADRIEDYRGLFRTRPFLAASFAFMLLSLAGMPPTMGFIAKFYLVVAGVGSAMFWLVAALVLGSVIGLFYYLRVLIAMGLPPLQEDDPARRLRVPISGSALIGIITVVLVVLGTYPAPVISLIKVMLG